MDIGKKIYYDIRDGSIILELGERSGSVVETTLEDDIRTYKALNERAEGTFDYIQLEFGKYAQDFKECSGYRINPETRGLEFSYQDSNEPNEPEDPIYQRPLSEQVKELETRTQDIELALADMFSI